MLPVHGTGKISNIMTGTNAAIKEKPTEAGKEGVEVRENTPESVLEDEGVSGMFELARKKTDATTAEGLKLSGNLDSNTAVTEIVALKQADAEFENKAQNALGDLKKALIPSGSETPKPTVESLRAERAEKGLAPDEGFEIDSEGNESLILPVEKIASVEVKPAAEAIPAEASKVLETPEVGNEKHEVTEELSEEGMKQIPIDLLRKDLENLPDYVWVPPSVDEADAHNLEKINAEVNKARAQQKLVLEGLKAGKTPEWSSLPKFVREDLQRLQKARLESKENNVPEMPQTKVEAPVPVVEVKPVVESVPAGVPKVLEAPEVKVDTELQKIDMELVAEKKAFEEFNGIHGKAHTELEQTYLDALAARITSLEFEKTALVGGDSSFETSAKSVELKRLAEKGEAKYQEMFDAFMNQPVEQIAAQPTPSVEQTKISNVVNPDLHLDDGGYDYGSGYSPYQSGQSFTSEAKSLAKPSYDGGGSMEKSQKPKGRVGKFIDGLKFWRYFTGKQE